MTHEFPPPTPESSVAIGVHLALLLLALASVAGLFFKRRRPARRSDLGWWLLAAGLATLLGGYGLFLETHFRPFLLGYMVFVWSVAAAGCVMTWRELAGHGRGPAFLYVFVALVTLGLLVLFLLSAVPSAREAAWRMQCSDRLKNIALAIHNWHEDHGRLPDVGSASNPPRSWRISLLPYLGFVQYSEVSDRYDSTQPWDSGVNTPVARTSVESYQCPTVPDEYLRDEQESYLTAFVLLTGEGTAFPEGRGVRFDQITDGTSNTLMVAEACGLGIVWTDPRDVDVGRQPIAVNAPGSRPGRSPGILSSYHPSGAQVAMADGSVQFISANMDPEVLRRLTTAAAENNAE